MRPLVLYTSGIGLFLRHELSHQSEDLDQCILNLTEGVLLPHRRWNGRKEDIIVGFYQLASALLQRSKKSKQPDDVNTTIDYLHSLRYHTLEAHNISRREAMTLLLDAFTFRIGLGSGNVMQDIDEMTAVCDELLNLDSSAVPENKTLLLLLDAILLCVTYRSRLSDRSIESLRGASMRWPKSDALSFLLAVCLIQRFAETVSFDDYNEAMAVLDGIIVSPRREHHTESWSGLSSGLYTLTVHLRSLFYDNPEYTEEAMSRFQSLLSSPLSDEERHYIIDSMGRLSERRLKFFGAGVPPALQGPVSLDREVVDIPRSLHLKASSVGIPESDVVMTPCPSETVEMRIRILNGHLSTISPGTPNYREALLELLDLYQTKVSLTSDLTDIKEAIKYCRFLIHSSPPLTRGYSSISILAPISLADFLGHAFDHTHDIEDINESITLLRNVLKAPMGQISCGAVFPKLISSLQKRNLSTHGIQYMGDSMEAVEEYFLVAADSRCLSLPSRLRHSCSLAWWYRDAGHPSVSTAYEKAMSLMEDLVIFAPNLQLQHTTLVSELGKAVQLPIDYASHLIHINQLERAIETLERGRALLWSELRGFRTSVDQLSAVDPVLAQKFMAINRDLEKLTTSILPSGKTEFGGTGTEDSEGADPFGRLLLKQRKLFEERDSLISHIKTLSGFEGFLSAPSFGDLRSAASCGPVILINHSIYRSDTLILHGSSLSLIPTSEGFFDRANRLKDRLLNARKKSNLDSEEYESALASVLMGLHELVGQPVINKLQELNIPEQSRVWWCPTSVFCSLPLHAMGPIPSDDGVRRYFSDLYIPSYTPTLSALTESHKLGTQLSRRPSLLLVAQPDDSLPGVRGEVKVIQELDIKVERLALRNATRTAVVEGLKRHEFVHFACHGILEIGKPFDASFKLHGDDRLTLLDIVHSQLPTAEFAFLSACHTAELTKESIDDEGLHLAAALQYCGFRSVVGTMWAMADTDGRDVSRWFYQSMLSQAGEDDSKVPYHKRSARALRDAVRELRDTKHASLERWVNFVHYGA